MTEKTVSKLALSVIQSYIELPFPNTKISCPYFNNRRSKVRAGLRVLLGKGSVQEIVDETLLFGLREKVNINTLSAEDLKKFLVDHNIGIDCSAFAYYILEAEYRNRTKSLLSSKLYYPHARNILRKLLVKLRPVENIGVSVLAHEKNSRLIELKDVTPGDMVIILNSGKEHNLNHVLLVYKVEYEEEKPKNIFYVHSFQWSTDGKYNHGIKSGKIEVVDLQQPLLGQKWIESNVSGEYNDTFLRAKEAEVLQLRRLKFF